jgi:hypothetical protein
LRREELERNQGIYLGQIRRQNNLWQLEALGRDLRQVNEWLKQPDLDINSRQEYQETLNEIQRQRKKIMQVEGIEFGQT